VKKKTKLAVFCGTCLRSLTDEGGSLSGGSDVGKCKPGEAKETSKKIYKTTNRNSSSGGLKVCALINTYARKRPNDCCNSGSTQNCVLRSARFEREGRVRRETSKRERSVSGGLDLCRFSKEGVIRCAKGREASSHREQGKRKYCGTTAWASGKNRQRREAKSTLSARLEAGRRLN